MSKFKRIKEFLLDGVAVFIACITSFWFWFPVLFAAYLYLQLWLFFAVHPLTILILPIVIAIYVTLEREKRLKAIYGIDRIRKSQEEVLSANEDKRA
ncbi:hypothetical protein J7K27_09825 [Candidatus Bathyarchaeota archaeon]|nr:hypothetical protein [Candidatus Bathyarchaeota archaeon]